MRIYTASKVKHAPLWRTLRENGWPVAATWIDEASEGETACYGELAARCLREVAQADVLLLYCEAGETLKGALIEVGAALALGKRVVCVGVCDSLSRVFSAHTLWSCERSLGAALERLRAEMDGTLPAILTPPPAG